MLKSPNSSATHPMGDRERLAIFNMLGDIGGKTVLDLFAGVGSLGLEALSRGAKSATFVENNAKTLKVLKENLGGIENAEILKANAYTLDKPENYDIVFIDPPYDHYPNDVLEFERFLNPDGVMVISSPEPLDSTSRKYANCYITIRGLQYL